LYTVTIANGLYLPQARQGLGTQTPIPADNGMCFGPAGPLAMRGGNMSQTPRSPEELLPYRTIKQFLASRAGSVHAVIPVDSALLALKSMTERHIDRLVVLDREMLVGVISGRGRAPRKSDQGSGIHAHHDVHVARIKRRTRPQ
jgi:hypothetical protein